MIEVAYEDGCVVMGFHWSQWAGTEEARALHDDPEELERASIEQLAKLFTVVIRQDRSVEGAILGACESGLIPRMLERVCVLDSVLPAAKEQAPSRLAGSCALRHYLSHPWPMLVAAKTGNQRIGDSGRP